MNIAALLSRSIAPLLALTLAAAGQSAPAPSDHGVVIDRIAAVLNGQAITTSEVEDAGRFAQFSASLTEPGAAAAACGPLTDANRQAALQHLIDERLLLESAQRSGYPDATAAPIDPAIARYRQLAGGSAPLDRRLQVCGLNAGVLRSFLGREASILAFLDDRLGAAADPSDDDIRNYYDTVFLPEARAQAVAPAPLAAVRAQIAAILREQRLAADEDELVRTLRDSAQIEIHNQAAAGPGGGR